MLILTKLLKFTKFLSKAEFLVDVGQIDSSCIYETFKNAKMHGMYARDICEKIDARNIQTCSTSLVIKSNESLLKLRIFYLRL